jgi:tRNA pseudouridine55 synthase
MTTYGRGVQPQSLDPFDGLLLVDKPTGMTSHDVVARIRRHFRIRKVGHGGTLDPMATGLLVILLGRGTKISDRVMGSDKVYEGVMRLGVATSTQDADGEVVAEADASAISLPQVEAEMRQRTGDLMQTPPMVSAIKKDGVPLYKLARRGEVVERQPRLIHVYRFDLLDFSPPSVSFRLACTKGTYVRTLCADIGEALGCGAHLTALRRTASGPLRIEDAAPLDALLALTPDQLAARVLPMNVYLQESTA